MSLQLYTCWQPFGSDYGLSHIPDTVNQESALAAHLYSRLESTSELPETENLAHRQTVCLDTLWRVAQTVYSRHNISVFLAAQRIF